MLLPNRGNAIKTKLAPFVLIDVKGDVSLPVAETKQRVLNCAMLHVVLVFNAPSIVNGCFVSCSL